MPFPKLSAVLNNCPLHALTPEIKQEVMKIAGIENYDNGYLDQYDILKNAFALYYEIDPMNLSWKQFADILNSYNAFDTQIILGPVLRLFMKDEIVRREEINHFTEINPVTARYFSLSAEEIFAHVAKQLGLRICEHQPQDDLTILLEGENPIDTIDVIDIYHQGGASGADAGGHWERTVQGEASFDYQYAPDTQLLHISALLGNDNSLNEIGIRLLKNHVRLTLNSQAITGIDVFAEENAEIALTAAQISKYVENIRSVPQAMAIELLNSPLTEETRRFISGYEFIPVSDFDYNARYIRATPQTRTLMDRERIAEHAAMIAEEKRKHPDKFVNPEDTTKQLLDTLLQPVSMPEPAMRRLAAYKQQVQDLEHEPAEEPPALHEDLPPTNPLADAPLADSPPVIEDHENPNRLEANAPPQRPTQPDATPVPRKKISRTLSKELTEAKEHFYKQLEILNAKSNELEDRGEIKASDAAKRLYKGLFDAGQTYFDSELSLQDHQTFKHSCDGFLKTERAELEKMRGMKLILVNIVLSISVFYLIAASFNYAINGRFGFFPTQSAKAVDNVEESIKQIGPMTDGH